MVLMRTTVAFLVTSLCGFSCDFLVACLAWLRFSGLGLAATHMYVVCRRIHTFHLVVSSSDMVRCSFGSVTSVPFDVSSSDIVTF